MIDAAAGMQEYPPSEDPTDRIDEEMPLLHRTLDAILRCLKRKAFNSTDDLIGIVIYNTVRHFSLLAYFLTQNRKKRNQIRRAQMLKSTYIAYSQLSN